MTINSNKTSEISMILIDSRVTDYQSLIDHLANVGEIFIIDAASDGVAQIASRLKGRSYIDALHIISHGSQGALYLGSTVLDSGNLSMYALQLGSIGSALAQSGDILLYGCNVAQGDMGLQFINSLALAFGTDVAASSNATGASLFGGDAVLEHVEGHVESISLTLSSLTGLLAINTAPSFAPNIPGTGMSIISVGRGDFSTAITLQANGKILVAGYSTGESDYDFSLIRLNADGSLDTSFDGDGKAIIPVGEGGDTGRAITLQADGKILLTGSSNNEGNTEFGLIRLNTDGSLDTSFDGDGKAVIPLGTSYDWVSAITLQADVKILVAATSSANSSEDFSLIRLNADGSLDTSFDGDGKAVIPLGTSYDSGKAITLQADGKILVVGDSVNDIGNRNFSLIRLNADGSLDTSFNGDGKAIISLGGLHDYGQSITLQADGKTLVAGNSYNGNSYDFSLIRLNANGSLDTSFDGDGKAVIPLGTSYDSGKAITLQTDGKILVTGNSGYDNGTNYGFSLIRLNADGSLDTSFNGDGKAIIPVGTSEDYGEAVTLQSDRKILVEGYSKNGSKYDFSLIRLNANGSLDTGFDGDGKAIIPVGVSADGGSAITLQADGKILVAGTSGSGRFSDFSLTRLNADGSLDFSFGVTPGSNTLGGTVRYLENAPAIALDTTVVISDPELAVLNNGQGNYSGASVTLARSTGANTQDVFGANGNLSFNGGNVVLSGTTIGSFSQSGGTLNITLNSNATQDRVNQALSSLTYANNSEAPPARVQINWTFSDGNAGAQGSGGALTGTGSTTVDITPANDAPTGSVTISGTAISGQVLTASNTLVDLDGLGSISYQWKAGSTAITGASASTYILTQAEVGKAITVVANYTDLFGQSESVTSAETSPVVAPAKYWKDDSKTPSETNKAGAVNLTDAIGILKMIVGLSVNSNNAPLSPYQAVAADFDQSGSVDLTDAIGVLKMVVGLNAPAPTWKYFDDGKLASSFNAGQPLNHKAWSAGSAIDGSLTADSTVKVIGVLTGDVDGSWIG